MGIMVWRCLAICPGETMALKEIELGWKRGRAEARWTGGLERKRITIAF